MKKQFRKIALAVMFAMAVASIAPAARVAEAATIKSFTYAEQKTSDPVSSLVMSKGEEVDIKFMGIEEAKSNAFFEKYDRVWVSSNPKVATVSNAGVITAVGDGVATVQYKISGGDGTIKYVSTGVIVYVNSYKQEVTIGTAAEEEIKSYTMEMGKTATLKANGLKDSAGGRYEFNWSSTDTSVATINKNGVITPVKPGLTVIQLTVKKLSNGEEYVATPIALQITEQAKRFTVTFVNNFYDNDTLVGTTTSEFLYDEGFNYKFSTSSTARYNYNNVAGYYCKDVTVTGGVGLSASELTVSGIIGGNATITRKMVRVVATATPTVVPTATATPKPTVKPTATATPKPTATATPTPTPASGYVGYTVSLKSDKELLLSFENKVDYTIEDIELYQLIVAGNAVYPVKEEISEVTLDSTGKQLVVAPVFPLANGEKYLIKAGSEDENGTTINVSIGEPNRVEIKYKCMGTEGVAYAYDDVSGIDVPVELSYRLYYGTIDVTETYANKGYITYEFASNRYYDNVSLGDDSLFFYEPNTSVVLTGTFTYYDSQGVSREVKNNISIRSTKLPSYGIIGVIKSTIIDGSPANLEKIDWNQTTSQVVANTNNAKIVAMIADTYGNYYVTDERGVDKENNIYYINDYEQLFSKFGYGIEFTPADQDQIIVASDGSMYPFKALSGTVIIVTLTNNGMSGSNGYNRNIGACQIRVLEESKLSSITAETTRVILASSALSGYESRFCEADVEIVLKDQYGNEWDGTPSLEISSTVAAVNDALDGSYMAPATITGTTVHFDARNIRAVTSITSIPFVITDTETNRKTTITVTLQNPTVSNGSINATGWLVDVQNATVSFGAAENGELTQSVVVETFKTSSNNIKVGLYDDLYVLETANHSFTADNCSVGQVYILVKGPDNKVVEPTSDPDALGVYVDTLNKCIKVNASAPITSGSVVTESLPAGKYTVTAYRIISVGSVVQKATKTTSFTIEDKTKDVVFRTVKSVSTPLTVSGSYDQAAVKEIVASTLTFNLGGEAWTALQSHMISDVEYVMNGNTIVIRKVEFVVPVDPEKPYGMSYKKTCEVNKAIKTGVTQ